MSKKKKIFLIVFCVMAVLIASITVPLLLRALSNEALATKLRAEYEKMLASFPHVPDKQNGALVILEGIQALEDFPQASLFEGYRCDLEREKDQKLLSQYLTRNEEALSIIEKGLQYDKWQYPIDYADLPVNNMPHILRFQEAGKAFVLKADLLKLDRKNNEALWQYMKTLHLGSTLYSDRLLISFLIAMSTQAMACDGLMSVLADDSLKEADLARALSDLKKQYEKQWRISLALETDLKIIFRRIATGIEGGYSVSEIGDFEVSLTNDNSHSTTDVFISSKYTYDFGSDVEAFRRTLDLFREAEDKGYYAVSNELNLLCIDKKESGGWLIKGNPSLFERLIPPIARCAEKWAINDTFWRGMILSAAILLFEKRNKQLPSSLNELGELVPRQLLFDPFSGKQLVYRLIGNDFWLYSVGLDGVDSRCGYSRQLFRAKAEEGEPDDIILHVAEPK